MLGRRAGQLSICDKSFNVAVFLDTKSDKYPTWHDGATHGALPVIALSVTLTLIQDHSSVKQF